MDRHVEPRDLNAVLTDILAQFGQEPMLKPVEAIRSNFWEGECENRSNFINYRGRR